MSYPPSPWHLQGKAILTVNLLDISTARSFVPPELEIVAILPGKTLGGVYLSTYASGSVLEYNELIVTCGLTRYQGQTSSWISHIYVDNATSVAGGREIWGLPKEMADFSWTNNTVTVSKGDRDLCSLKYQRNWLNLVTWWKPQFSAGSFGGLNTDLLHFNNQFAAEISLLSSKLTIPTSSPFASLQIGQPWLTINMNQLNLTAGSPQIIGQKSIINL
jgi:acetoacetate decarboxylase